MGRKKGFVPFAPWEARKADEKGYVRLAPSLMYSDAVMGLNHAAHRVFMYMRQHSIGKPEFDFPHARFSKLVSNAGFQAAISELVRAGLIEVAENNAHRQKPNLYRFSEAWKNTETARDDGGGGIPSGKKENA